jgi:putative oxidoreductase
MSAKQPGKVFKGAASVVARILLCSAFLAAMFGYTNPNARSVAEGLAGRIAVSPQWAFMATMALLSAATVCIVLGYRARWGALLLLLFAAVTTWLFQGFTFWNVVNSQARSDHMLHLVLNLSLMGAMLLICVNGPGAMSFDARRK